MLSNLDSRRYIFIDVIGNPPAQHKKAGIGYQQISNGILIRDFAINISKSYDVKILAYGNGEYYNNFHGMNNKYYFQIDIENIFQIYLHSQIDFDYYTDFKDLLEKIENMISINEYSSVILFLDNLGFIKKIQQSVILNYIKY